MFVYNWKKKQDFYDENFRGKNIPVVYQKK